MSKMKLIETVNTLYGQLEKARRMNDYDSAQAICDELSQVNKRLHLIELEKQIQEAGAVNERSKTYKANLERDKQRRQDSIALADYEAKHREIKAKKQFTEDCPRRSAHSGQAAEGTCNAVNQERKREVKIKKLIITNANIPSEVGVFVVEDGKLHS